MIRTAINVELVIEVLNRAIKSDPEAMHKLIEGRVPCNQTLADDETIQVSMHDPKTGQVTDSFEVGILGLINGFFGTDERGWGCIAAVYEVCCTTHGVRTEKGVVVGAPCPDCGDKLVLGKLLRFEVLEESMPDAEAARKERAKDDAGG